MNPFAQLRQPDRPVAPDPRFAARLKARITEALQPLPVIDLPERRTEMSATTSATTGATTGATTSPAATPPERQGVIPYLGVHDAAAALTWYADVFDAVETVRYVGDDGRIGHAELAIAGNIVMLADEYPEVGALSPRTIGGSAVMLSVRVADVDAVYSRAIGAGATGLREPNDEPYGERSATFLDPFGHRWSVQTPIATPTVEEIEAGMPGYTVTVAPAAMVSQPAPIAPPPLEPVELGYVALGFDDTARATRFYGALFGWQTEPGHAGDQYAHVANTRLPLGFTPDGSQAAPILYFRVDDVDAAAGRVVELGGEVVSRAEYPSGRNAVCHDDQGRQFQLWQPAPGY